MPRIDLRQRLRDRSAPLTGTFVLIPRVEIVEALAYTGFGALILDFEHGPFTVGDLPPLVAATQGAGSYAIVRVADPTSIGPILDTGVDGILVPHVGSRAEAAAVVEAVRHPPEGSRSINPYVRAAKYDGDWSEPVATMVMVEGADGLAVVSDIAAVPGVDSVFVGPVDLSAALGFPGEPEHPQVIETITTIMSTLSRSEVAPSIYCPTAAAGRRWLDQGARFIALSADIAMAMHGFRTTLDGIA